MSDRKQDARVIHPLVLEQLGADWVAAAFSVADDLRSGVIPPEDLDMRIPHGRPCCAGGHMSERLVKGGAIYLLGAARLPSYEGPWLFDRSAPSDPLTVAHALETFVATCVPDWGRR